MRAFATLFCVALTATAANAAFDLQITETWSGNEPGSNLTEDWFEVTNFGDMAWTSADGDLYFDDDSADTASADLISGVTSIAPGESVVFVNDSDTADFVSVWGASIAGVQLGTHDGSGMSQNGDGATLFVTTGGAPAADFSNVISFDLELYPDANAFGGQSYDVTLGAFSTIANGAFSSVVANDENQFAIGSPGSLVPEPTTVGLALVAGLALAARRRG